MKNTDISKYANISPVEMRRKVRTGELNGYVTAGMCAGYAQANLVILPRDYAEDFKTFAQLNPGPCPILEILDGDPYTHDMGKDGNILTDIPEYFIYKDGKLVDRCYDATPYWQEDMVGFLIGCSFSFEEALMREGIEIRHIATGRNVPMYKTNCMTKPAGPFHGPIVCSMRPMTPENAGRAYAITAAMPNVHGAPLHIGDPAVLGVIDVDILIFLGACLLRQYPVLGWLAQRGPRQPDASLLQYANVWRFRYSLSARIRAGYRP